MAQVARFLLLAPLVLALVSFVLTSLILFAGQKEGFMEDYAVVRVRNFQFSETPRAGIG